MLGRLQKDRLGRLIHGAAVALLGTLAVAGGDLGARASELKPLKLLLYPGLIHQQTMRAALGSGIFKKHGLDVSLVQVESGPAGMAAVQGDSIDIGAADSNLPLLSNVKGSDFQIVCGASGLYFVAVTGPNLKSADLAGSYPGNMKAFVGKKLGVTGLGASTHFFWQALFQGAGLDPNAASYVAVGLAAPAVQALRTERIDAYMGFEPVVTMVRDGGLGGTVAADLRMPGGPWPKEIASITPQLTWYAKRSFISKNADTIKAFNAALLEAVAWQKDPANLDKLVEIMRPTASLGDTPNKDVLFRKMIQDNISVVSQTAVTAEGLKAWVAFVQKFSGYPKDIDVDKVVRDTIWEGACK